MPKLREIPVDMEEYAQRHGLTDVSMAPLLALLSTPPGEEPPDLVFGYLEALREAVACALRYVSPEARFIIDGYQYEHGNHAENGRRLGVTRMHATRLYDKALDELKEVLINFPVVRERLGMTVTWENAAFAQLAALEPITYETYDDVIEAIDTAIMSARDLWERGAPMRDVANHLYVANHLSTAGEIALGELIKRGEYEIQEMVDLLAYKQSMYGHRNILDFGVYGLLVRMSDKRSRLENIHHRHLKGEVVDDRGEGELDTLRDILGYTVIGRMLVQGSFTFPLARDLEPQNELKEAA